MKPQNIPVAASSAPNVRSQAPAKATSKAAPFQPHEKINFNLRPNKRIERKLVAEALNCIYRYDNVRQFAYIGMGSYYFADFVLFHRMFGIDKMVSIESDSDNSDRFIFNKPFDCIKMEFGLTHDVLPRIQAFEEAPVICWLDYYSRLNSLILGDVDTFLRRAKIGSALIITLSGTPVGQKRAAELDTFFQHMPNSDALNTVANKQRISQKDGLREFMLDQIEMRIEDYLATRNVTEKTPLKAKRIIHMAYKDAAPMVTYGWLLLDNTREQKLLENPGVLDAPGISLAQQKFIDITTPALTFREINHLKALLPHSVKSANFEDEARPIKKEDAEQFARFYRYFPSFADVEE